MNYLGKFIPNLATVTEPIRILLRKDTEFEWSYEQDQAFQEIKAILTKDEGPVLRFFDVRKPVRISRDASSTGLARGSVAPRWISSSLCFKIFNRGRIQICTNRKRASSSSV